ncbi:hypothetical protein V6N12_039867 [Hibiscus sabdariffa]|uniref:Protein SYS1 homolog n=1 Tax=Hibiscus sabdariffa TaxID=183260 RepID=A0ABR2E3W1_9ROSI
MKLNLKQGKGVLPVESEAQQKFIILQIQKRSFVKTKFADFIQLYGSSSLARIDLDIRVCSSSDSLIYQIRVHQVSILVMFYGAMVWDPWLIVAQIVCLQCLYYLTLGVFLSFLVGTHVSRMSLVYFFDFATLTSSTLVGWCVIASFLFSAIAGAGYMIYLIERAKKCLDFSATLYIIHLFICLMYGGWPSSVTWWVVNGTGVAVMALLGEYLCIKRERKEIPTRYRSNI